MTEQKTVFVLGNVDTERLKTELRLRANFLINYNHRDGLRAAHGLHEHGWPIDAIIIALNPSDRKQAVTPKHPWEFVSRVIEEFGDICPILVASRLGYRRLPLAEESCILCHSDELAQKLAQVLKERKKATAV